MGRRVHAVIPAAGCGLRFGGREPKQYVLVSGQPLIFHTVNSIARFQEVEKIILVVDDTEKVERLIATCPAFPKHKVVLCRGDATRHRSIKAGIDLIAQETEADVPDLVMIHDGARPLMPSRNLTTDLFDAAESRGAAGFYLPLVSTLLEIDPSNGDVKDCVERAKYVASETPQAFTWNVIRDAYLKCSQEDLDIGTECLDLARKYANVVPMAILGTWELFKVTHRKDIDSLSELVQSNVDDNIRKS